MFQLAHFNIESNAVTLHFYTFLNDLFCLTINSKSSSKKTKNLTSYNFVK